MVDFLTLACFAGGVIGMLWFTCYAFVVYHVDHLEIIDVACAEVLRVEGLGEEDGGLYHRAGTNRPPVLARLANTSIPA